MEQLKKFTIYWIRGDRQVVEGTNVADACNRAGISTDVLPAKAFCRDGDNQNYTYDREKRSWVRTTPYAF